MKRIRVAGRLGAIAGLAAEGRLRRAAWELLNYGLPVLLIFIPVALFLVHSFYHVDIEQFDIVKSPLSLVNFERLINDGIYIPLFFKTCWLAIQVALICLVIGYPVAYFLASLSGRLKYVALLMFVIPLLMSYLIKIYAIQGMLGKTGFINHALIFVGLLDEPTDVLLFNMTAVKVALTIAILPFAILPIFVSLEKIPKAPLDASADLGARAWPTFRRVIVPMSLPGTVVGVSFTFVLAVGDFIAPQMVGGISGFTYGRAVYSQFGMAFNWPFGATLALLLLVVVLVAMVLAGRLGRPRGET